jgi:hypothetical protein
MCTWDEYVAHVRRKFKLIDGRPPIRPGKASFSGGKAYRENSFGSFWEQSSHKKWSAFCQWTPVLASYRIPLDMKLHHVLKLRIHPVLEFGMKLWAPPDTRAGSALLQRLDDTITACCHKPVCMRQACGLQASFTKYAWQLPESESRSVVFSDMLLCSDACHIAHVRLARHARVAEACLCTAQHAMLQHLLMRAAAGSIFMVVAKQDFLLAKDPLNDARLIASPRRSRGGPRTATSLESALVLVPWCDMWSGND